MADLSQPGGRGAGGEVSVQPAHPAEATKYTEDGNALCDGAVRLNPEAMRGVPPLIGLDDVEAVLVQPAQAWARWTEGLLIHVVGSGLFAVTAFCVGLLLGSPSTRAGGAVNSQPKRGCVMAPVPEIKDRNG